MYKESEDIGWKGWRSNFTEFGVTNSQLLTIFIASKACDLYGASEIFHNSDLLEPCN